MSGGGTALLRRLRTAAGDLLLLSVLTMVAALLVTGVPRYTDHLAVQALTADLARAPSPVRDLSLQPVATDALLRGGLPDGESSLDLFQSRLPATLHAAVRERWYAATVPGERGFTVVPAGAGVRMGLRTQTGLTDAAELVAGRWPETPARGTTVQVVLSVQIAPVFGLRVGDRLRLGGSAPEGTPVVLVGLFRPRDAAAPFWVDVPDATRVGIPGPNDPYRAVMFTDPAGLQRAGRQPGSTVLSWRFRFDEADLAGQPVERLITEVLVLRDGRWGPGISATTGLAALLERYQDQQRAARALLAVVGMGLLLSLLAATVLAARLAAVRRRQEYALLRARGAGAARIGLRALVETVLTVPAAAALGWALGTLAPGRAQEPPWAVPAVAAAALLATVLSAVLAARPAAPDTSRQDLTVARPSAARLVAELSVTAFALIGVYLLRRRGLGPEHGVDLYLAAVPGLLAAGVALLALRLLPVPVTAAARVAARARGVVAFLGLHQIARSATVQNAPLAVLVVAVTTGLFAGAVATGVTDARDRATDRDVGADVQLRGDDFSADTGDRLAALPGVAAVAPAAVQWDAGMRRPGAAGTVDAVPAFVVDGPAYQRVLDRSGIRAALPEVIVAARRGGAVPAVVSTAVAADLGGPGTAAVVQVRGRLYDVTIAAVADYVPGLGLQVERFVVLPWQAMPAGAVIVANRFLVAGERVDAAALRTVGDAGQLAYLRTELGREPPGLANETSVVSWARERQERDRTGANSVLSFTFRIGVLGGAALALLAVGFAVLIGAYPRGQVLSRLRTMGLPASAGRRLLIVELAPMVGLAVLLGAVLGIVLPAMLRPALDLASFSPGVTPRVRVDPLLGAAVPALVVLALAVAVVVESLVNRRMRLGEALRISEER